MPQGDAEWELSLSHFFDDFQPDDTSEVHSSAANRPEAGLCLIAEMAWISSRILLVESKYTSSSIL